MKKLITLCVVLSLHMVAFGQCWQSIVVQTQSLALKTDGTLWAWGYNTYGELGDGTTVSRTIPKQIGIDRNWKALSAGYFHSVAIKTDGTLWGWGDNSDGELGDGTIIKRFNPAQIGTDKDWRSTAVGYGNTVAIKTNGTLWAWGANIYGEMGDGTTTNILVPTQVGTANDWQMVGISHHTVALKKDGTLWAWGFNLYGQLGLGDTAHKTTPRQIGVAKDWQFISVGSEHTMAIKTDGTLWAWGHNWNGQLGDGTSGGTADKFTPEQIGTAKDWQLVSAGNYHTMAIKKDGTLWGWGNNSYWELGDSSLRSALTPKQIGTANDWQWVSAGNFHTMALKKDGTLWGCGDNFYGELGDSTTVDKVMLTRINIDCSVTSIDEQHTVANNISFTLYPNPADNRVFIKNESHLVIDRINILDMMGKEVLTTTNTSSVNIASLATGVYVVQIVAGGTPYQSRLVKR